MAITLPYSIDNGDPLDAVPIMADLNALAGKFSAGIVDEDIASVAAINAAKLAGGSITTDKIGAGQVKQANLELSSSATTGVGTTNLVDGAVTTAKLANSSSSSTGVTSAKLADAAVTTAKLGPSAVTLAKTSIVQTLVATTGTLAAATQTTYDLSITNPAGATVSNIILAGAGRICLGVSAAHGTTATTVVATAYFFTGSSKWFLQLYNPSASLVTLTGYSFTVLTLA